MKWHRSEPGRYVAGPYRVTSGGQHRPLWTVTGPGIVGDGLEDSKRAAQDAAYRAMTGRMSGNGRVAGPVVVGDVVEILDGRAAKGVVAAEFPGTHHPVFSILLPRGRRLCLERTEFALVLP